MSLKKRLLRVFLILLLLGGFTGYFAFSTIFFAPHEGDLPGDVSSLVPRDVDFFVAKADVAELFEGFPDLAVAEQVGQLAAWQTFVASPEYARLTADLSLEDQLRSARETQGRIPLGIQLVDVFGGTEVSAAGYFGGQGLAEADWAVYGHLNFFGKLAIALLEYPGLIGLPDQGITATSDGGHVVLSGAQLPRDLYVTRIKNVGVVSTSLALVQAALDLEAARGQDSFGQSARYYDHIENAPRGPERDEVEIYVDMAKYMESAQITAAWPDPKSEDFTPNFLGHLFQRGSVKELAGTLGVERGIDLRLHGEFRSDALTSLQTRLYRRRGTERARILDEVATLAPEDTALFVYLQGDVADLLRQVLDSLGPDTRELVEDAFKKTGEYTSLEELVGVISSAVHDRLALIVREHDYAEDPDGPPHDDTPVFAAALIAWTKDKGEEKIVALRDTIGENGSLFGLQGHEAGEPGYWRNFEGGFETREFWNPLIPGTGVVATVTASQHTILSNQFNMLGHLLKVIDVGGSEFRSLADRADFRALLNESLEEANVLVWVNPQEALTTLRKQTEFFARDSIQIDWATIRAQEETKAIRELYPGKRRGQLEPAEQAEVDARLDPIIESMEERIFAEQLPLVLAEGERRLTYSQSVSACLLMLALDPKKFDLSLQVVVPY